MANAVYAELVALHQEANLLASAGAVLGWDERTYLPPAGSDYRGRQMGLIARLTHEMLTAPHIGELLNAVKLDSGSAESANVREMRRAYNRATKLEASFVEELTRVTTIAQGAWQEARQANNFAHFQPHLEKVLALKKQEANAVGYASHPYDALLDEYEPGASALQIKAIFQKLVAATVPLLQKIQDSNRKPDSKILAGDYPLTAQETFGKLAAGAIGFDFNAGRLDTTTHPFCSGITPGDCRITTRYNPRFFNEAFFGILHEAGHGIYEQGLPAEHFGTPLGSFCSLGIHESQSRLWENQVGRSAAFWQHFYPLAKQHFPSLASVDADAFHFAINEVKPSFIRVEADEITYNLHIALRFELELELLSGNLPVAELPAAWNKLFTASFGITPPDDARGCLQDIHWSMGGIGYFPTYTLGNLYAAQFMNAAKKDLGDLSVMYARGEFLPLKAWLNDKIHQQGRRYLPGDLCERITGEPLTHNAFVAYLQEKYGQLYGIA
jgi:carboxypeptidase Taq